MSDTAAEELIGALGEMDSPQAGETEASLSVIQKKLTPAQQSALALRWCRAQIKENSKDRYWARGLPSLPSNESTWTKLGKLGMITHPKMDAYPWVLRTESEIYGATTELTDLGVAVARAIFGEKSPKQYCAKAKQEIEAKQKRAQRARAAGPKARREACSQCTQNLISAGYDLSKTAQVLAGTTLKQAEKIPITELKLILELAEEGAAARAAQTSPPTAEGVGSE